MYYIVTEERRTWGKFLVEADTREQAIECRVAGGGEDLGEATATDSEIEVAAGPFENRGDAEESPEANII